MNLISSRRLHPNPIMRRIATIALAAVLLSCAKNPVTGRSELTLVSETEEIQIGSKNYVSGQQDSGGRYLLDPELEAYVRRVGQSLARVSDRPQLPFEFAIINDSVPNAWAMPGGKIAVHRGLLTELRSEAELAAVLGHEIVHAAARHGARSMETGLLLQTGAAVIGAAAADRRNGELLGMAATLGAGLVGIKYGRDHELEADRYGMTYMVRAGYDPAAAVSLQETFVRLSRDRRPGWLEGLFASHPPSQERVDANRQFAATLPRGLKSGEDEYRRRIAGIEKSRAAYAALDEGRKALDKGDARAALVAADKAIALEPREALFHGLRGDALLKSGSREAAEASYNAALQRNPDYYQFHLNRGLLRHQGGDRVGATAALERSMALRPTALASYNLGVISNESGQPDKAIAYLRAAASSGDGEVGQRAGALLVRLDLPRNPAQYLKTEIRQEADGRLTLRVRNTTNLRIRNIEINARLMENAFSARQSARFRISAALGPGESGGVITDWNLRQLGAGLERIDAQVVRATLE